MRSNVYLKQYKTKKGENRYLLVVREYGYKERYIQLGPVSKKVAEERRVLVLHELLTGKYRREPKVHLYLSEFVEKFFTDYANGSRAPKTILTYHERLKSFLVRFHGYRLNQITRNHLEQYLTGLTASNRTKNITLSILRSVFKKAVEWDYLSGSPVAGIRPFSEHCVGSRALTPKELRALWNGQLTAWQKSVIRVMVNSGMRPGELSSLKFEDIDWEADRLAVVSDHQRKTKTRKTRYIPLNQELKEELLFLKENLPKRGGHQSQAYLPRKAHQRNYVFCQPDGSKTVSFKHSIDRALARHGIKGVTPHGLRKTFFSMLARQKVHPRVAQELLGHADMRLTMKVYTQIDDDQLREAVNQLPNITEVKQSPIRLVQNK